ncbi:MAG: hypothetical protein ACTHLE_03705 [Agriterribacter sp.]
MAAATRYPSFTTLANYAHKNSYFVRVAQWYWLKDNMIAVIDPHNPRMLSMDPWPQSVFLAAEGKKTVSEYIHAVADDYTGEIPASLDQTIIEEIEKLAGYRIILLVDEPQDLNDLFKQPVSGK